MSQQRQKQRKRMDAHKNVVAATRPRITTTPAQRAAAMLANQAHREELLTRKHDLKRSLAAVFAARRTECALSSAFVKRVARVLEGFTLPRADWDGDVSFMMMWKGEARPFQLPHRVWAPIVDCAPVIRAASIALRLIKTELRALGEARTNLRIEGAS